AGKHRQTPFRQQVHPFRSPIRGCRAGDGLSVTITYYRTEFVVALRTAEQMSAQLIAWHLIGARRLNHAERWAPYTPLIWKAGRKMLLCDEDQIFRIGQITGLERSIHLGRRRVIFVCGVALHCILSKIFPAYIS